LFEWKESWNHWSEKIKNRLYYGKQELLVGAQIRKKGHDNLFYGAEEYSDFKFSGLIKLTWCNNGLVYMLPLNGMPAYDGKRKLQILDDTAKYMPNLEPYQTGSRIRES